MEYFSWDLGNSLCKLFVFVAYCCTFSSLLIILLMSVQRYYQVLHPSAGPVNMVEGEDGHLHCVNNYYNKQKYSPGVGGLVMAIFGLVLPVSLLLTSYIRLHKRVKHSAFFRKSRMTRLVTSIIVTFIIGSMPFQVVIILNMSGHLAK
ncbi:unnamed protein product [Coregonus sp. 'balchen']|nr:unnamed protein product [Coregonus sp. 'balchen']